MDADSKGSFKFTGLSAGKYAISVGDGEPLARDIEVGEEATVVRDIVVAGPGPKIFDHYLLLPPLPAAQDPGIAEAKLILGLASHYLHGEVAGGFSVDEATLAQRVTIVGDRVPASAESTLSAAGCQVARLSGDGYAIAAALAQVFAEG